MRFRFSFLKLVFLLLISTQVYAGKDPIAWSLNRNFVNPVLVGRTYSVVYTLTNQLPFQMVKALQINKTASPANEFSYVDNCSGVKLARNASCTVEIDLIPETQGEKSVQLTIAGYSNDQVPLPELTTSTDSTGPASLTVLGAVTQALPGSMTVGQSGNYLLTFTNKKKTAVTGVSVTSNQSSNPSYASNCGSSLGANGGSCTVSGVYTPTSVSPTVQTVYATLNYSGGSPVTASTSTTVSSASGVVASFVSPYYLPAEMVGGSSNQKTIWVTFTNYTGGSINITSRSMGITIGAGGSFTIDPDPAYDNCNGSTLTNGAACQVRGVFQAPTVVSDTQYAVTATINYTGGGGGPTSLTTSTYVVSALSTSRTVTFVNECNFPVWFSLNGSALGSSPNCASNPAVCPTGSACNQSTGLCYWNNIAPGNNTFALSQSGGGTDTNSVTIPLTSADPTVQWSGNFSASTLCNGSTSCSQADCSNHGGSTACSPGVGFSQPATQAEITMNQTTSDSYDVEEINGFHIPISMTPGSHTTASNYNCGVPGSATAGNGFGACAWDSATPPGSGYYWVTGGGSPCNISAPSCTSGTQLCGLDSSFDQVCGNFLGYWTAAQVCGSKSTAPTNIKDYFNCNSSLGAGYPANSTLSELMLCAVPTGDTSPLFNSCYLNYSGYTTTQINQCCGCVDWWDSSQTGGTTINANSTAQSCTKSGAAQAQSNPIWTSNLLNTIKWLKQTCPSSYVYTFDDATSGFSCTNNLPGQPNSTNYTITFCPGGHTGLPAGKTEGRG